MKHFIRISSVLVCLCMAVGAQEFWEKKDISQWNKGDCQKLLTNSPWAGSWTATQVTLDPANVTAGVAGRSDPLPTSNRDSAPQITYMAQIWSARPIRLALARAAQLDPAFEKLSKEEQAASLLKQAEFINAAYPEIILIRVAYSTNTPEYVQRLARYWQNQTPADLQKNITLMGTFGRIQPTEVLIGKGTSYELRLAFPRTVNGKPLLSPTDKTLAIEFQHPELGVIPNGRVYITFSPKKMMVKGEQVY